MNRFLLIVVLISFFNSCKTSKDIANNKTDYVMFSLRKTECRGKCPVFFMEIFKSGIVVFEGVKNIDKIGKYEKTLSKKEIKNLQKSFDDFDFFSFENEYTGKITDLPSTYISYTNNGQTKQIRDYFGAPEKLKELEEILNEIAQSKDGWKKIVE
ncbi:MAG: hypothetical protein GX259_05115 [Bacteroidales bacterium]|nr:hypothetical protein [Bacteroidales bacterium]